MSKLGDIQRAQVTEQYDIVVTQRYDAFYAGVANHGYLILDQYKSQPYPTEAQARAEANRYYAQLRQGGIDAFSRSVSLYRADDLAGLHERQAEILRTIPRKHRRVVSSRAHLLQNITGGILSGNLYQAAAEYRRVGAHELERMSKRDNHSATQSCGCSACQRSVSRAS